MLFAQYCDDVLLQIECWIRMARNRLYSEVQHRFSSSLIFPPFLPRDWICRRTVVYNCTYREFDEQTIHSVLIWKINLPVVFFKSASDLLKNIFQSVYSKKNWHLTLFSVLLTVKIDKVNKKFATEKMNAKVFAIVGDIAINSAFSEEAENFFSRESFINCVTIDFF